MVFPHTNYSNSQLPTRGSLVAPCWQPLKTLRSSPPGLLFQALWEDGLFRRSPATEPIKKKLVGFRVALSTAAAS